MNTNKYIDVVKNSNWTFKLKRWKNLNSEEKMNRLWFYFKFMMLFVVLSSLIDIFRNMMLMQQMNQLTNLPIF